MSYLLDINIKYLNIYIKVLFTQFQGFVFTSLCPPTSETKPNIHPWACAWIMQQSIQQSIKGKSYCTFVSLTWIQYGDALGRGTGVNGLTIHPRSHGLLSLFQHPVLHHSWNQSKKGSKVCVTRLSEIGVDCRFWFIGENRIFTQNHFVNDVLNVYASVVNKEVEILVSDFFL